MAIKTKDELLATINGMNGENVSDEVLALIEDISDTLDDYESRTSDNTNWRNKYEENDKEWRQKYRDRFLNTGSNNDEDMSDEDETPRPKTFEDLFTFKED